MLTTMYCGMCDTQRCVVKRLFTSSAKGGTYFFTIVQHCRVGIYWDKACNLNYVSILHAIELCVVVYSLHASYLPNTCV